MSATAARTPGAMGIVLFLCLALLPAPPAAGNGEAFVLNGLDNTLSSVDLASGLSTINRFTFNGFPNHAVIADGRLYVVASGSHEVVVLDAQTLTPIHTLTPGAGSNPYAVAVDAAGNVFVSLFVNGEVVRYDAAGQETGRATVGRSPEGLLLHDGLLYVANTGFRPSDFGYDPGTISVLDPVDLSPVSVLAVGINPQWVRAHAGRLHVLCTGDFFSVFGEVHVVHAATGTPEDTLALGGSPGFLELGEDVAFATDYFGGIYRYQTSTGVILNDAAQAIHFGGSGYSGTALDATGNLYVALFDDDVIAHVRGSDGALLGTFPAGDGPATVVLREETPVPVRVLAYTAARKGVVAELRWRLGDSHLAAKVVVERAAIDGGGWVEVARVSSSKQGSAVDNTPPATAVGYRLSALLRDGSRDVLAETSLAPIEAFTVALRANPVRGFAEFTVLSNAFAPVAVSLFDARGARVRQTTALPKTETVRLSTAGLPAGVYFARIAQKGHGKTVRLVVAP